MVLSETQAPAIVEHAFHLAAALVQGVPLSLTETNTGAKLVKELGLDQTFTSCAVGLQDSMLHLAAKMDPVFELSSPDAPGLCFLGGVVRPTAYNLPQFPPSSASGRGLSLGQALASLAGEGAEYLCQLRWGDEELMRGPVTARDARTRTALTAMLALQGASVGGEIDLLAATHLASGQTDVAPADLCLRKPLARHHDGLGFGAGCAAGDTIPQAQMAALLELIERDAVALWWLGGRRGCAIDAATEGSLAARQCAARVDSSLARRRTWMLDITTDLGVPCVVAFSCDDQGCSLACGFAARPSIAAAATAALEELYQMELGNRLVIMKSLHQGPLSLAPAEQRQYRRMTKRWGPECLLLLPADQPRCSRDLLAANSSTPHSLATHLDRFGIDALAIDLSRGAIGIPTVRVLAPELQPLSGARITKRLVAAIAATGGGAAFTDDIALV